MKKSMYLFAVIGTLILTTAPMIARQQGPQTREEKRKLQDVRQKQGLKEAAKLYGVYIEEIEFDYELAANNLTTLAAIADLVGRGIVKNSRTLIVESTPPGYANPIETIVTDYTVQMLDIYKGEPRLSGREITVRIPGGRVGFGNGLYAEIRRSDFVPILAQDEFILFLNSSRSEEGFYSVTFGRQGLFEIKREGSVSPRARVGSPVAKNSKKNWPDFAKQLHEAIVEAGKPRKIR